MKFKEYRKIKLSGKKKVAIFFLSFAIAMIIYALILIYIPQILISFLDQNNDKIVNDLIDVSGSDLIKTNPDFDAQLKKNYDVSYRGNPCDSSRKITTNNPEFDKKLVELCGQKGNVSFEEFKALYIGQQKEVAMQQGKEQLKEQLSQLATKTKNDIQSMIDKYFFLDPKILITLLLLLLIVYLVTTDLVLFIDYVFRKVIDNVIFLVIIPYVFFNTNLLDFVLEKVSAGSMNVPQGTEIPSGLISKIAEVLSKYFSSFYSTYMLWSIVILAVAIGAIMLNRHYLLPRYSKGLKIEQKTKVKKKKK